MNEKRLQALITLLDDPDDSVFRMVEQEMLKEDAKIVVKLEQIWETSLDSLIQTRIETLIRQIQFSDTKEKIHKWSTQKTVDLFDGFFLITRYQYPDLKLKQVLNSLDKITQQVWLEFNNSLTSLEKITVLNHMLYDIEKFSVNHTNFSSPQNAYLNQLLETKKGNPVSLAILYMLVARRLKLPVFFIDFPKNPLLAYVDSEIAREALGEDVEDHVLFYINPSNKGAIVGRREIDYFMKKNEMLTRETFTVPCDDKLIIRRLLDSLIQSYDDLGYQDKMDDLTEIASML